jgi:hypothetical protein
MKIMGNYIVASGVELSVRPTHVGYHQWHVTDKRGMLVASYHSEQLADLCAKGLNEIDLKIVDQEMDNILRST